MREAEKRSRRPEGEEAEKDNSQVKTQTHTNFRDKEKYKTG